MNAILGRVVSVKTGTKQRGLIRATVQFKPTALLPDRGKVPAWLADQVLAVDRRVADVREVGDAGDAIALSAEESDVFLAPLIIEPATIIGDKPSKITLKLRWWKDQNPPQFSVAALGQKVTGEFTRRGGAFSASVATKDLLDASSPRPFEIVATCQTLSAICPVVSSADPGYCRFLDRRGDGVTLLNPWYAVDVIGSAGGAIVGFRERARAVDHLAESPVTQKSFDKVGHVDHVLIAGNNTLTEAKLAFAVRQREASGTRVEMEGVIDEGKNARSTASYRLLDALPILELRRSAILGEAKADDKKKTPAESLVPLQLGFRHAFLLEGDGVRGSQIIAPDGDRLGVIRAIQENDYAQRGEWWLKAGWALVHHPLRRQAMLFLLDGERPAELASWAGGDFMTFEPHWLGRPYLPPAGAAFALALSAGEVCGASLDGAWIACQAKSDGAGIACAAVAKLRDPKPGSVAEFHLGRQKSVASLSSLFLEGVGQVHYAVACFPPGKTVQPLDATVAGIPSRNKP